ncbi:MAG: hypothetical protein BWZ10_03073 [candidate division BRC1 bacterium ADurb.BinA364]|nr:MAG: hypothetical protein BWZ10_03073 [candidate division BRC1 bacterium ADurb.BinA364]
MDFGIGGILELLRHIAIGHLGEQFLGLGYGPAHAFGAGSQNYFGAQSDQHAPPLDSHGLGHHKNQTVSLDGAYHRQANPRIAARRLDDRRFARPNQAARFGRFDHGVRNAVLDAEHRIERFELGQHLGHARLHHSVQANQWRIADQIQDRIGQQRTLSHDARSFPCSIKSARSHNRHPLAPSRRLSR